MSDPIMQNLAANVLRLGNEVRDLSISNAVLRQENEELHKDYEALADEHTKLIDRNKTLKAEVERLRASSFVTAVPVEEYEKLKAEVERLEHQVRYWRIEAETDNARWLRCLAENDNLRKNADISPPQSPQE